MSWPSIYKNCCIDEYTPQGVLYYNQRLDAGPARKWAGYPHEGRLRGLLLVVGRAWLVGPH